LAHNNAKNLVKSVAVKPKAVTQQAATAAKKKTNVAAKTAPIAKKATAKRVAKKTPAQPK